MRGIVVLLEILFGLCILAVVLYLAWTLVAALVASAASRTSRKNRRVVGGAEERARLETAVYPHLSEKQRKQTYSIEVLRELDELYNRGGQ